MSYSFNQTVASGETANVSVPFPYLDASHVHVSLDGEQVDDADLSWVSSSIIALTEAPAEGTIVRVYRETPATSLLTVYSAPNVFDPADLNNVLRQLLYVNQEAYDTAIGASEVSEAMTEILQQVTTIYEQVQEIASEIEDQSGMATLAEQWATSLSVVSGGLRGARYYAQQAMQIADQSATGIALNAVVGMTAVNLQEAIEELLGLIDDLEGNRALQATTITGINGLTGGGSLAANRTIEPDYAEEGDDTSTDKLMNPALTKALIDENVASAQWSTGDAILTFNPTPPSGWIMADDGSIGSTASDADTNDDDTEDLYLLLWAQTAQAQAPVNGGRGASAAEDFADNKKMTIPKALGRALCVAGAGAGLTSRVLGLATGAETVALIAANNGPHSHGGAVTEVTKTTNGAVTGAGEVNITYVSDVGRTIGNTSEGGSGTPHANIQPSSFWHVKIKL
jgi:hypothetical protein